MCLEDCGVPEEAGVAAGEGMKAEEERGSER